MCSIFFCSKKLPLFHAWITIYIVVGLTSFFFFLVLFGKTCFWLPCFFSSLFLAKNHYYFVHGEKNQGMRYERRAEQWTHTTSIEHACIRCHDANVKSHSNNYRHIFVTFGNIIIYAMKIVEPESYQQILYEKKNHPTL